MEHAPEIGVEARRRRKERVRRWREEGAMSRRLCGCGPCARVWVAGGGSSVPPFLVRTQQSRKLCVWLCASGGRFL